MEKTLCLRGYLRPLSNRFASITLHKHTPKTATPKKNKTTFTYGINKAMNWSPGLSVLLLHIFTAVHQRLIRWRATNIITQTKARRSKEAFTMPFGYFSTCYVYNFIYILYNVYVKNVYVFLFFAIVFDVWLFYVRCSVQFDRLSCA